MKCKENLLLEENISTRQYIKVETSLAVKDFHISKLWFFNGKKRKLKQKPDAF